MRADARWIWLLFVLLGCSGSDDDGSAASVGGSGSSAVAGSGGAAAGSAGAQSGGAAAIAGGGGAMSGSAGATAGGGGAGVSAGGDAGAMSGEAGASTGEGGAAAASCEDGVFSGPELRDCDLPGACGRCMWEKACASFLFRCAHDADCVCMAECVGSAGVGGTESCLDQCGLTESPPGFAEWVKGASDMCWDEGCGVLGEPPPDPGAVTGGDTGSGTEPDCAFDTNLSYDPCGEVLQLQSEDGSFCVRIERREDGPGGDANTSWTLLDARVGPLGQVCHTDDTAGLCWFSSHHNYSDWAHVTCGDLHYDVNMAKNCGVEDRSPSPTFRLHIFESAPTGGTCAPTADGSCPVVAAMDLLPVP
jgi:hypothetical protein